MIARPQLTPLTSVRVSGAPRPGKLNEYYQQPAASKTFTINRVEDWVGFTFQINASLSQLSHVPNDGRYTTIRETILEEVMPILLKNRATSSVCVLDNDPYTIGKADFLFVNRSYDSRDLVLLGLSRPEAALNSIVARSWAKLPKFPPNLLSCNQECDASEALQSLTHCMALNGVQYGFVASEFYIRFVHLITKDGSNYDLSISKSVTARDVGKSIVALCLKGLLSHNMLPIVTKLPIFAQPIELPDVSPFSRYVQGSSGGIKCSVAKNSDQKFYVQFDKFKLPAMKLSTLSEFDSNRVSLRRGVCIVGSDTIIPALMLISEDNGDKLRRIASMLQYLNACAAQSAPNFVVFGELINVRILALKLFNFERLTVSDLDNSDIVKGLHKALDELHSNGVVLRRFDLNAFLVVRETTQPIIKIIGLDKARLFKTVPDIARKSEHSKIEWMSHCSYKLCSTSKQMCQQEDMTQSNFL